MNWVIYITPSSVDLDVSKRRYWNRATQGFTIRNIGGILVECSRDDAQTKPFFASCRYHPQSMDTFNAMTGLENHDYVVARSNA